MVSTVFFDGLKYLCGLGKTKCFPDIDRLVNIVGSLDFTILFHCAGLGELVSEMGGSRDVRQVAAIELYRGRVVPTSHTPTHVQHLSLGKFGIWVRAVDDVVVGGILLADGQHGDHGGPGGGEQRQVIGEHGRADVGPGQVAAHTEVAEEDEEAVTIDVPKYWAQNSTLTTAIEEAELL